eukprot:ANDGO_06870.mRNA.1 hypothetical protein DICPUDRAFT_55909
MLQYVHGNELCDHVIFVHMFSAVPNEFVTEALSEADQIDNDEVVLTDPSPIQFQLLEHDLEIVQGLRSTVDFLQLWYPSYRMDLVLVNSTFTPLSLEAVCKHLSVSKNFAFISCPGKHANSAVSIGKFAGVRIVVS